MANFSPLGQRDGGGGIGDAWLRGRGSGEWPPSAMASPQQSLILPWPLARQPLSERESLVTTRHLFMSTTAFATFKPATSGPRMSGIVIQWFRTSAQGTQEHYYTTKLEDAIIVAINNKMHNCQDPGNSHFTHLEEVQFSYRKITWTHEVSGTSGSDDWRAPVV